MSKKRCFKIVSVGYNPERFLYSYSTINDDRKVYYELGKHILPVVKGTPLFVFLSAKIAHAYFEEHCSYKTNEYRIVECQYDTRFPCQGYMMGVCFYEDLKPSVLSQQWIERARSKNRVPGGSFYKKVPEGTFLVTGLTMIRELSPDQLLEIANERHNRTNQDNT